ncbi:hypothetical protein BGX38DRAFT_747881 [Terfezia claveryi]|nr:hypothetical protein BGX38DRAFT_747881 [Terfezia claveryi]
MVAIKLPTWAPGVGDREIAIPAKTAGILAAVGVAVMGSIPFLVMQYFSPPYVTHLHLHLPPYARHSPATSYASSITPPPLPSPLLQSASSVIAGCANLVWRGWDEKRGKMVEKLFYVDERGSPARAGDGKLAAIGVVLAKVGKWTEKGGPEEEGEKEVKRKEGSEEGG